LATFYLDKPLAAEPAFQSRCDALNTWYNVHTTLKHHFALLRRWTGSDTLDVNQPYTNHEINLSSWSWDMSDGTTFVERLLKEESMQLTFEKGFLVTVHNFLGATRDAQVNLSSLFKEMNLPTFEKELVPLISFPTRLAQAGLRLRLDYVQKLKEPDIMIIDQMTEDLKLSIGLACTLKATVPSDFSP
jgi:mitogen-activated protein kinase kinase kinase